MYLSRSLCNQRLPAVFNGQIKVEKLNFEILNHLSSKSKKGKAYQDLCKKDTYAKMITKWQRHPRKIRVQLTFKSNI